MQQNVVLEMLPFEKRRNKYWLLRKYSIPLRKPNTSLVFYDIRPCKWMLLYVSSAYFPVSQGQGTQRRLKLTAGSGVTGGLRQGGKPRWKGRGGHSRGPTTQISKKTWEVIVNPVVDGHTKSLNHQKILWKTKKTKYKLRSWQGGDLPRRLRH